MSIGTIVQIVCIVLYLIYLVVIAYDIHVTKLEVKLLKKILRLQMFGMEKKENDEHNDL